MLDWAGRQFWPSAKGLDLSAEELTQEIIGHCMVNLADFKVVRDVHMVSSLPRSTLEKIAKNELRARLQPIKSS
jgi:crotonobetaine/carnitine-CoA ligase